MTRAYSYIRFSSERQKLGQSLQRQVELAEAYAAKHNLELDTLSFRDLGKSAAKGQNAVNGALATFLKAVDAGLVPKGSFLLIEAVDRLSRADVMKALSIFTSIIERDVQIVTVVDEQIYSKASIKDNWTKLIVVLGGFASAHEEVLRKGRHVKAAWDKKRASGKIMTRICPPWMEVNADKTAFILKQDKVAIIRRMFDMSLRGIGVQLMATTFNREGVPVLANGQHWSPQDCSKLLHNRAVLGTLVSPRTGEVSEGYYGEGIIDADVFNRVQQAMTQRNGNVRGRKGENVANLLSGLTRCGKCGTGVRFVRRADSCHLQCLKAYHKAGCDAPFFDYQNIEDKLLYWILNFEGIELAPKLSVETDPRGSLSAELEDKNKRLERYLDQFETTDNTRPIKLRMDKLAAEIESLEKQLASWVKPAPLTDAVHRAVKLYRMHDQLKKEAAPELKDLRVQLQSSLRSLITNIRLLPELHHDRRAGYYKWLEISGPLVELVRAGEAGEIWEYTDDGYVRAEYGVKDYGLKNSRRIKEFERQNGKKP